MSFKNIFALAWLVGFLLIGFGIYYNNSMFAYGLLLVIICGVINWIGGKLGFKLLGFQEQQKQDSEKNNEEQQKQDNEKRHNYICYKCNTVVQGPKTPVYTPCPSKKGAHVWEDLGLIGNDHYQCPKCGVAVKSKKTPVYTTCPKTGSHTWGKM